MTDFIIIGNANGAMYKNVFPLFKDGKVRFGYNGPNRDMYFNLPEEQRETIVKEKREGSGWKNVNGVVCGRLANACWFTTCSVEKEPLVLSKTYTPEDYPKYDNYDAINVDRVEDIPYDYDGVMGVPVSFLAKCGGGFVIEDKLNSPVIGGGQRIYKRVIVKKNLK